jgi:hypothetical protein
MLFVQTPWITSSTAAFISAKGAIIFAKKLMKLTETSTSRVLDAPEFQFEKGEFNLDVRSGNCLQICLINFPR